MGEADLAPRPSHLPLIEAWDQDDPSLEVSEGMMMGVVSLTAALRERMVQKPPSPSHPSSHKRRQAASWGPHTQTATLHAD